MENQTKRVFLAASICVVIIVVWGWLFAPKPQPVPPATPVAAPTAPEAGTPSPSAAVPAPAAHPLAPPPATPAPRGLEQRVTLETPLYEATFSSYGGGLASFALKGSQYTNRKSGGQREPMNLVPTKDNPAWYPLRVGTSDSTFAIPADAEWKLEKKAEHELTLTFRSAELEVVKSVKAVPGKYALEMAVAVTNVSAKEAEERLAMFVYGVEDPLASEGGMFSFAEPRWGAACYEGGKVKADTIKELATQAKSRVGDVRWTGVHHKYFLLAVASPPAKDEQRSCAARVVAGQTHIMETELVFPAWKLQPGDTAVRKTVVYAGPKLLEQLEGAAALAGGAELGLPAAVDLGWVAFLARPMLSLLKVFHGWVKNWGIAIILLTITVKLLTLYWTQKSMRSMKAMSKLKPKIDELRVKYASDKQRQNVEMMNLYKNYKINPLGGCLPMLLQMPVWIALYQTLGAAAELYQAPFVGWLDNMTAPDPYYIMPVAMTLTMFLQAKLQPAAVDSQQQKMMMYMMPLMFGGFSLVFPMGLTVYMFTNTLLTMAHQVYMNKTEPEIVPVQAPVASPAPGKKGRPGQKGGMAKA
jgi:YidC/Oxa1 family membrane protein insertase